MLYVGSVANVKHVLQKELFTCCAERLLSVVTVTKTLKKKRACYLCVVTSLAPGMAVTLCLVKQSEQRDVEYKKKSTWQLDEIKWVDGHLENFDVHEFDIHIDRVYKWYALNLHERQNFLTVLYKQIRKHVRGLQAEFRNIPLTWLVENVSDKINTKFKENDTYNEQEILGKALIGSETDDEDDAEWQEFTALTDKESNELSKLYDECDYAIRDAELLLDKLTKELYDLDGANIQSVLASEQQVLTLMEHIDLAIDGTDKFEQRLDTYEEILSHVKETMEKISGKNAMIKIANNNNLKLREELNKIITNLDLPLVHQHVLEDPNLKTLEGRQAAILAARCLKNALNSDIDPELQRLVAVRDQMKRFEKWRNKFLGPVSRYLNNLFIHLSNEIGDMPTNVYRSGNSSENTINSLKLPDHSAVHRELTPHTELMHWIIATDRKTSEGLSVVYTKSLSKIYDRDLRNFFVMAKMQVSEKLSIPKDDQDQSMSKKATISVPYGTLGVNREQWTQGIEPSDREYFDSVLEQVLAELEPVALHEQQFCINFFQMDIKSPTTKLNSSETFDKSMEVAQSPLVSPSITSALYAMGSGDNGSSFFPKKVDRQINEDVRKLMNTLFGCLEQELVNFIQSFERYDCFYSLYVLERLTQHVMSAQDTHSFLSMTFASVLIQVKRNFDRFMQQQLQSIRDAKVPKRSKCGILPYVENFEYFSQTSEEFFRKSNRRTDMEKFIQLINTIFEAIDLHARDHPKTPIQVVRMENYHHMYSLLAQLKVSSLDDLKKEAKARYNDALKAYVTQYFGRPLEKLNLFFEGVQQKIAQGVKEIEISYQMAFSKQELRKVISLYPAPEVKKGLDNLYKKVEKHLCEEENLLQVVWHAMQEEFIEQYKFLEERIQKCYAGAMITLEFNIQDILHFFSDIARSH